MDCYQTLLSRRTIHDFRPDPIPEAALLRALEAAIRAPNHKLTNPWRFTRMGPAVRHEIVALAVALKSQTRALSPPAEAGLRAKLSSAPELLAVSQRLDADLARRHEDYASVSCAIENLMLALWSEGIGSKWSTGAVTTHPSTYGLLGIDEAKEEIVGFVWIGFALNIPSTPRLELDAVYRQTL
ncbi:MAG: nitroreductase family protein [Bradymonadaceae bacterium]|nr:nitroreductase family protein [Lujinxingiaceae bacterium]